MLRDAIELTLWSLPRLPTGIATLGMLDAHASGDEDYLVVGPSSGYTGSVIHAHVRRPELKAAQNLKAQGALAASGILIGYTHAIAAHICRLWPQQARTLKSTFDLDDSSDREGRTAARNAGSIASVSLGQIRLIPPVFPMRAFTVQGSGWCRSKALNAPTSLVPGVVNATSRYPSSAAGRPRLEATP